MASRVGDTERATDTQTPVAVELHAQIVIQAPVEVVWRSLIEDVGSWWPHSFNEEPRISMEPWIGGRFMEEWDGGAALYALVTRMEENQRLTVSGAMGMPGARQYVKTYELEADGDATIVRTTASMLGDLSEERRENYRSGGIELLEAFKRFVESR